VPAVLRGLREANQDGWKDWLRCNARKISVAAGHVEGFGLTSLCTVETVEPLACRER
jgi:hypothetical protein